jgi:hypothetical protein
VSPALRELLETHLIASLLKQERLQDALGDRAGWAADLEAGTLRIADLELAADVIGTESIPGRTFVWGWANPSIPRSETADALRRLGAARGIAELTDDREQPVEAIDAGVASIVASGVEDLDGYFLGVDRDRAIAFAIRDAGLRARPVPVLRLASAVLEVASVVELGHRRAFAHYLARPLPEVPAAVEGGRAVLRGHDATAAVAFDREGRVADVRLQAPPPGA